MSAVARHRTKRPRRSTRSRTGLKRAEEFRLSVAADPRAVSAPAQEARLTKAALLYGDRVTVLSPVTGMLLQASELGRVSVKRQVEVLQAIAPLVTSGPKTVEAAARASADSRFAGQGSSGAKSDRPDHAPDPAGESRLDH